ncbi:MAG: hypothetical protein ACRDZ3_01070, partial [Acidimicrobiia bacterium]
ADLDRQLERHGQELEKINAKLGDEKFTSRAPAHVVDDMRRREAVTREAMATLQAQRDQLAGG